SPCALSSAGLRDGICHGALHVPHGAAHAVRGRRRGRDGAQGLCWPRRLPRRRGRDRARSDRPSYRRPFQGLAERPPEDSPPRGQVVPAGDAAHLYAHIDSGRIFPITYNVAEVVEGYETLKKLASSPSHVVPGHDPPVLARYPAAKAGLEGWVVRLDAEPKS